MKEEHIFNIKVCFVVILIAPSGFNQSLTGPSNIQQGLLSPGRGFTLSMTEEKKKNTSQRVKKFCQNPGYF